MESAKRASDQALDAEKEEYVEEKVSSIVNAHDQD